jgi:hypothetical protein
MEFVTTSFVPAATASATAMRATPGSGAYPAGVPIATSTPHFGPPNISECAMLFPSPT